MNLFVLPRRFRGTPSKGYSQLQSGRNPSRWGWHREAMTGEDKKTDSLRAPGFYTQNQKKY